MFNNKKIEGLKDFVNKALDGSVNAQTRVKKVEDKIEGIQETVNNCALADDVWQTVAELEKRVEVLEAKKTKKKK